MKDLLILTGPTNAPARVTLPALPGGAALHLGRSLLARDLQAFPTPGVTHPSERLHALLDLLSTEESVHDWTLDDVQVTHVTLRAGGHTLRVAVTHTGLLAGHLMDEHNRVTCMVASVLHAPHQVALTRPAWPVQVLIYTRQRGRWTTSESALSA